MLCPCEYDLSIVLTELQLSQRILSSNNKLHNHIATWQKCLSTLNNGFGKNWALTYMSCASPMESFLYDLVIKPHRVPIITLSRGP